MIDRHRRHGCQRSPLAQLSAMNLQLRAVIAIIVTVGFCQPEVGQHAPSVTKTFRTSQSWQYWFTTESRGPVPMGAPPTSCTNAPGTKVAFTSRSPRYRVIGFGWRAPLITVPPAAAI